MRAQRAWLDRATGEAIPAGAHFGPGKAEDLGDDAEFKRAQAIVQQGDDQRACGCAGSDFGMIYTHIVICANCKRQGLARHTGAKGETR